MRKTILLVVAILAFVRATAQDNESNQKQTFPRFILKWSITDLADYPTPILRIVLEQRFNQKNALEYSLGYGQSSILIPETDNSAFKARLGYRRYLKDEVYLMTHFTYKRTAIQESLRVCRANCAFFERLDGHYDSDMIGLTFGVGHQLAISDKWYIDYGAAVGGNLRWTTYEGFDNPNEVIENTGFLLNNPSKSIGRHLWPYLLFQCKLGYAF